MGEQLIAAEQLDQILDLGLDHNTHQSTLRKAARDVTGQKFVGDAYRVLCRALEERIAERKPTPLGGYVAVRKLTLLGEEYLPGDPVPADRLKPNTRRLLVGRHMIQAGGAR